MTNHIEPPATVTGESQPIEGKLRDFSIAFGRAKEQMNRLLDLYVEPYGLTSLAFTALFTIQSLEDRATLSAVGAAMQTPPSTMTGIATRLERDGLVERSPSPLDRRASILAITPRGEQVLTAFRQDIANDARAIGDTFGRFELDQVVQSFEIIAQACEQLIDRRTNAHNEHQART